MKRRASARPRWTNFIDETGATARLAARLPETVGKLRQNGCRQNSWSRRREHSGLDPHLDGGGVRTGEAGPRARKALTNVATET